jgi:hypothetical protein
MAGQRCWYRVEMTSGPETFCVFGSSVVPEKDMVEALNGGGLVLLEDLVYYDEEGKARSWSEWDPHCQPRVYLNSKYMVSLMPMVGDPRTMSGGLKILSMPHFMRDQD